MAGLVKAGALKSMNPLAGPMNQLSRWLEPLVSDMGAMFVELEGISPDGGAVRKRWCIIAAQNHGPHIPCGAAIALTEKLAGGAEFQAGARPCMGLLNVEEYLAPLRTLDIRVVADPV